ncbi:hypothetical protein L873DRAFT_1266178 [Choiromyces venosus 120613-1]|uniref:Uncharacterized protein n=1 Tax=Choiromyces venosus 120613-1 TaxID=1336337 RepID=A0A3N4JCF4_9PEZI|nr:hypothetical protein L873DRAFT_1266178 [Choiromyces venosus 120613-1]
MILASHCRRIRGISAAAATTSSLQHFSPSSIGLSTGSPPASGGNPTRSYTPLATPHLSRCSPTPTRDCTRESGRRVQPPSRNFLQVVYGLSQG